MADPRSIEFFIPWVVKPKQSFRMTKGGFAFPDPKVKKNAFALAGFAAQHRPEAPFKDAVSVDIVVHYPWRKSESKKRRARQQIPKDTRPDWDNLSKQVCDVLESCGFFLDDGQIARVLFEKFWGSRASGVEIRIRELIPGKEEKRAMVAETPTM